MWTLVDTKTRKITKPFALEHATLPSVEGERDLNQQRMTFLEEEIINGRATAFHWATASIKGQQKKYRVNGNHSSHILSNGCDIPENATATVEHYECDTKEDLLSLWARFDSRRSSRSKREILHTHLKNSKKLADVSQRIGLLASNALSFVVFGYGANKVGDHDRCILLSRHAEFVCWLDDIVDSVDGRKMFRRTGVAVAMFKSWQVDREACKVFWGEVLTGSNPNQKSATRVLQKLLLSTRDARGPSNSAKTMDMKQVCHLCILAWNHWRNGNSVNSLRYVRSAEIPRAI